MDASTILTVICYAFMGTGCEVKMQRYDHIRGRMLMMLFMNVYLCFAGRRAMRQS